MVPNCITKAEHWATSNPTQLENPPYDCWEELAGPNISALKGQCGGEFTQAHKGDHDPILRKKETGND